MPFRSSKTVSIVICTYGRPESLNETLKSLAQQTFQNFEIILLTKQGSLAELRDEGLKYSTSDIVSFIDDDVYCRPTWLQAIVEAFQKEGVVGVSGPTIVTEQFRANRDIFKYRKLRWFTEKLFKVSCNPGHLSETGTPSMASNFESLQYEGKVEYLECCNMSIKRKEAIDVGGFDHNYKRTGEWSEVDLALKIGKKGRLYFSNRCGLYHRPSIAGIYAARLSTKHRFENFMRFQRKWIKPSLRTYLYRGFVWIYLKMKEARMI